MIWPFNFMRYRYQVVYSKDPEKIRQAEEPSGWKIFKIQLAGWSHTKENYNPFPIWKIRLRKGRREL